MTNPTKRQKALLDELLEGVNSGDSDTMQVQEGLMNEIWKRMVEATLEEEVDDAAEGRGYPEFCVNGRFMVRQAPCLRRG